MDRSKQVVELNEFLYGVVVRLGAMEYPEATLYSMYT